MERRIALTFDGAPNPPGTYNILATLEAHRIRATFFMEGHRVLKEKECAMAVKNAGHEIGNHSFSHRNFDELSLTECQEEILRADAVLRGELGVVTRLLRPPGGRLTDGVRDLALGMGYDIVLWTFSIRDWEGPDSASLAARVLEQVRDNCVVVFHDRVPWVPEALEIVIPALKREGFEFKTVSELGRRGIIK
ncbi:MAG: polysaccharide deacetylase family protein [Thermoanaerobacteraceae bacterium]|nr:polysaccharide deacetylase family protein [Thermoanaerobacteraceae bacterium]